MTAFMLSVLTQMEAFCVCVIQASHLIVTTFALVSMVHMSIVTFMLLLQLFDRY